MPKIVDASLVQAQLLEEAQKLFEKLARLKASLRAADALCEQRIQTAALREIDQYRAKHVAAHEGCHDTTATEAPLPGQKSLHGIHSTE
jgi:hypothetical protein